jgi:hypothetical protein
MTEAEMTPWEWIAHERRKLNYGADAGGLRGMAQEFHDPTVERVFTRLSDLSSAERDDRLIQNVLSAIQDSLPAEDAIVLNSIPVVVYPTYKVEGVSTRTPKGDRIILLHSGLPLTLSHLCCLELHEQRHGGETSRSELLAAVAEISALWKVSNVGFDASPALDMRFMNQDDALLGGAINFVALSFVIGHEFGHIFEDHGPYSTSDKLANHKKELYADQWGLRFALRIVFTYITRIETQMVSACKYALLGPFLALGMIAMLAPRESMTHPAPTLRRDQIMALMCEIGEREIGEQAFSLFERTIGDLGFKKTAAIGSKLFDKLEIYNQLIENL